MKRSRVVAITATLAALAATGVGASAASGAAPSPGPTKPGATAAANDDIAAVAAALGVTPDELTAAMVAAKMSLVSSTNVTPDAFVAAVAANLGLPAAQVQAALEPMFAKHEADKAKADSDVKQGVEDSPFTTDAAAASLASALGVDQARARSIPRTCGWTSSPSASPPARPVARPTSTSTSPVRPRWCTEIPMRWSGPWRTSSTTP